MIRAIASSELQAATDHFKNINDTHGHTTGDRALRLFVDVLRTTVRQQDMVVRYGGEEFIVVLPAISRTEAIDVIDRVRLALTRALDGHEVPRFSASFGIADSTQADTSDRVITLADTAMMHAKNTGRDRVIISGGPIDGPARQPVLEPSSPPTRPASSRCSGTRPMCSSAERTAPGRSPIVADETCPQWPVSSHPWTYRPDT